MSGYTKLFGSILDSTVWELPLPTKVTWIAMLAMADRHGAVEASIPGLAKRAGVTLEQCEEALTAFLSPDRYSRTKEHEGRRIEETDGGWQLLNHAKYREQMSADIQREKDTVRKRKQRARAIAPIMEAISERDGEVCGICAGPMGEGDEYHIDHITPRVIGGCNSMHNLQLSHAFCNTSKCATPDQSKWRHPLLPKLDKCDSHGRPVGSHASPDIAEAAPKAEAKAEAKKEKSGVLASLGARDFIAAFCEEWSEAYEGEKYKVSKQDSGQVATMVKESPGLSLLEWRSACGRYVRSQKPFYLDSRHPIRLLCMSLNEFSGDVKPISKLERKTADNREMFLQGQEWAAGK